MAHRGRQLDNEVRDWIVAEVEKYPLGVRIDQLREAFRKTDFDFSATSLLPVTRELAGDRPGYNREKRIHICGYVQARMQRGHRLTGGRTTPVFAPGAYSNAKRPEPGKNALYHRARRASESAAEAKVLVKRMKEVNRAIKRAKSGVFDDLTAALFGHRR